MNLKSITISIGVVLVMLFTACQSAKHLTPGEGYIEVPGGRVWYRIVGDGPGTPLLVLHGGPGVPSYYMKPLAALGNDRPVIFYDQLGCGRSDKPSDTTLWRTERFVQELAQVRKTLSLKEVDILGHSWGTMLAMDYVLTKPNGVKALVMSSPSLSIPMWVHDADSLLTLLPDSIQQVIATHEADGTYDSPDYQNAVMVFYHHFLSRSDPWSADTDSSLTLLNPEVYGYMCGPSEFAAIGTLKDYDRTDKLGELTVPTLFTAGEYDEASPPTVKYYQSLVPGSELVVIPGSGHLTMQDDSTAYIAAVRDFLNRVDAK